MRIFGHRVHCKENPWTEAPDWALELGAMGLVIIQNQERIMAAIDDLNNAVTALATGFAALDTVVQTEIKALTDALASGNDAAITQAASNISAITSKMAGDAAALTASIPAATTVPPPPAADTPPVPPVVEPPVIATPPVTDPNAAPPSTPPDSATTA